MDLVHEQYGLRQKYKPIDTGAIDYAAKTMPRTRMANGTTQYLLYLWAIENDEPIHITEHDSTFVGLPPDPIYDGVIQTSSHVPYQLPPAGWGRCGRAQKRHRYEPDWIYDSSWGDLTGVIPHPLNATNGTSGYIIGPGAAAKMVEYIDADGIAFADRVRGEHVGDGNVYLQVPQSVTCDHRIKSHRL